MRALLPQLDHGALVTQAARHGLSGVLAQGLDHAGLTLAEPWASQLVADAQAVAVRAHHTRRLTLATLDALEHAGLPTVALKGYVLAARLYPDPLSRVASDVDVWVRQGDRTAAGPALKQLGLTLATAEGFAEDFGEPHDTYAGTAGLVELHFTPAIGPGGAVFPDIELWERSVTIELDGRFVRCLSPEDEFTFLAVHAANHAFLRASWLVDLQRFMAAYTLDWQRVAHVALQAGFVAAVSSALDALEGLLAVDVSAARAAVVEPAWRREVNRRLFSPERVAEARLAQGRLSAFLLRLSLVDGPARAAQHLRDGAARLLRRLRD